MRLTPDQKRIALVLCDRGRPVKLRHTRKVREVATGMALARKGLARRLRDGRFEATDELRQLADGLRAEDQAGKVPPRSGSEPAVARRRVKVLHHGGLNHNCPDAIVTTQIGTRTGSVCTSHGMVERTWRVALCPTCGHWASYMEVDSDE